LPELASIAFRYLRLPQEGGRTKRDRPMKQVVLAVFDAFVALLTLANAANKEVVDTEQAPAGNQFEGLLDIDRSQGWEIGRSDTTS
jgi:hypothetical protein